MTLLLALASATCSFNHASAAAQEEGRTKTEVVTTSQTNAKAVAFKTLPFLVAGLIAVILDSNFHDKIVELLKGKLEGNKIYLVHGILLIALSFATAFVEDWFCGCDDKEGKSDYTDVCINAGFYLLMTGLALYVARFVSINSAGDDKFGVNYQIPFSENPSTLKEAADKGYMSALAIVYIIRTTVTSILAAGFALGYVYLYDSTKKTTAKK